MDSSIDIQVLEKALELACERLKRSDPILAEFDVDVKSHYIDKAIDIINQKKALSNPDREEW